MGSRNGQREADHRDRRQAKVAELMLCGWAQGRIARELGVSDMTISRDVKDIRAQWMARTNQSAQQWIGGELAALTALRDAHLPAALAGDRGSTEVCLQVGRDIAKLLGLHAPVQVTLTMGMVEAEINRLERSLGITESDFPTSRRTAGNGRNGH